LYPIQAQSHPDLDAIREAARDFAVQHIAPHVMEWDEAQTFPLHVFHAMGEMGFMGMLVDPEYGGSGLGYAEYITVIDEISERRRGHAYHRHLRR